MLKTCAQHYGIIFCTGPQSKASACWVCLQSCPATQKGTAKGSRMLLGITQHRGCAATDRPTLCVVYNTPRQNASVTESCYTLDPAVSKNKGISLLGSNDRNYRSPRFAFLSFSVLSFSIPTHQSLMLPR